MRNIVNSERVRGYKAKLIANHFFFSYLVHIAFILCFFLVVLTKEKIIRIYLDIKIKFVTIK